MKTICLIFSCAGLVTLVVASGAKELVPSPPLQVSSKAGPLKVWSHKDHRYIDEETFIEEIAFQPLVLLGEVHDNPLHHRLRGQIVSKISVHRTNANPQSAPPAAVFEHASTQRQPQFDALSKRDQIVGKKSNPGDSEKVAAFFKAADWTARGWPDSELFVPLVSAILKERMPLYAGDVPRQRMKSVVRGSSTPHSDALSEAEIERLKLDQSLGTANNNAALSEIKEAHCGVLPKSMLPPMAYAQRLRDATLADVLLKAAAKHGAAILFAGNGHVRSDRGVPWYVRARTRLRAVSVMIKERQSGSSSDPGLGVRSREARTSKNQTSPRQAADYVIWTASRERPDPCRKLREKYGKTKR